ncbi:MAG: hypothetical protein ACO1QS_15260 [Verrucomicrobiota bacterium]
MKVGHLTNLIVLTAKWLRIFGIVGFAVVVFLFERGPLFDPSIEPVSEKQARFVAVEAIRKTGFQGKVVVSQAKYEKDRWLVVVEHVPQHPSGFATVEIAKDGKVLHFLRY